jgi:hypothetical protein
MALASGTRNPRPCGRGCGDGGGGGTVGLPLPRQAGLCLHPGLQPGAGRVIRAIFLAFEDRRHRILVPAPLLPVQPVYESLQGRHEVGPLPTPRRYLVPPSRHVRLHRCEPRFHFTLAGEGDPIDRTRVRKPYIPGPTCLASFLYLVGHYPSGRENARPAQERFSEPALSTLDTRACERVPRVWMHKHMPVGG